MATKDYLMQKQVEMTEDGFINIQLERIIDNEQTDIYSHSLDCNVMFNKLRSRGYVAEEKPNIGDDGCLTYMFKKANVFTKAEGEPLLFIINAKKGLTRGFRVVKLKNYLPF